MRFSLYTLLMVLCGWYAKLPVAVVIMLALVVSCTIWLAKESVNGDKH